MGDCLFSIVVPTFNRHNLLRQTLESLHRQTYSNFEVIVLDGDSDPPVQPLMKSFNDPRFRLRIYDKNHHPSDNLEDSLDGIKGDCFLCLEDDNGLIPSALERIAGVLRKHPGIDILGANFMHYNHSTGEGRQIEGHGFSGALRCERASEVLWRFCSIWGIGPICPLPPPTHFSATFYSIRLLHRAKKHFGMVFVKPFGDISLLALLGLVQNVWLLDLPLSYIGEHEGQITNAGKTGQRHRLKKSIWVRGFQFRHSPLHALSYINVAVDCHLEVLHRLGLEDDVRARLRPLFFRYHLDSVMSDSPWTRETWRDLFEVLPHLLSPEALGEWGCRRLQQVRKLLTHPMEVLVNRMGSAGSERTTQPHFSGFHSGIDFAEWIENNQVEKYHG